MKYKYLFSILVVFIGCWLVSMLNGNYDNNMFCKHKIEKKLKCTNPIGGVFLFKNKDKYSLCVNFAQKVSHAPIIHKTLNGVKILISFCDTIVAPPSKRIDNSIIKGYFFEKIGKSSLMLVVSFKNDITFEESAFDGKKLKMEFLAIKRPTIAIDPGHGGADSGTVSISGDLEKNIALMVAIELRNLLVRSTRYNVILTRASDILISIDSRKKYITRDVDLLISLHTDNNENKNIKGMSIFTLPDFKLLQNYDTLDLDIDSAEDRDLYFKNLIKSRRFSKILSKYIPNICKIPNKPCRSSELKILKVKVPAVLVELGCVSNKIDDQLLHSEEFRDKTINAILYAIDDFFEKGKK